MNLAAIESNDAIIYIILFLIVFFVSILFTRWLFRIEVIADNLKVQTTLLAKIAKYNNVPEDEIYKLLNLPNPNSAASKIPDDSFDAGICTLITESGTSVAINYLMKMKDMAPGHARTYVDRLIDEQNLTPKK